MTAPSDSTGPGVKPGDDCGEDPEPAPPDRLHVEIVYDGGRWEDIAEDGALIEAARRAFAHVAREYEPPSEMSLLLADDDGVHRLNKTHRGQDHPTNVLSFPSGETEPSPETGRMLLGDLALAADTILAEAAALGIPARDHAIHLVVHGVLHLLGYDHDSEAEAEVMEGIETAVLAGLGVADPYAGSEPVSA